MYTSTETGTKTSDRGKQIIWYLLSLVELILALRFVLKLFGASPANWFAGFVYAITAAVVAPFARMISSTQVLGNTFEYAVLLAMFVCWLIAAALSAMFRAIPGKGSGNYGAKQKRQAPV